MESYLRIKSFLGQEKNIELLGGCSPFYFKDKELVEEPKSFIHRPEEVVGNDPSFGERRPSGVYQLQKCPKTLTRDLRRNSKVLRTIKERAKAKPIGTYLTHKGTGSPNWNHLQWTVFSIWLELLCN
ncbi:hypothetical protein O181_122177 [Austropuccinia psidii MF-1]|uniref:Uncharacterized protein n=1 Tax=Austropuccinia psidii MF-1 TaxID=1389203 RepID=A0A9Q3KKB4_9BASI|nr:hypothetical protein [Austropuccinia psidii MF-1]